jgi:hypothetical protein
MSNTIKSSIVYQLPKDGITRAVISDLSDRAERGLNKYSTTLEQNNTDDFLNHLYEELLDAAQYIKKEIVTRETIQQIIKDTPNNQDLGEKIRKVFSGK